MCCASTVKTTNHNVYMICFKNTVHVMIYITKHVFAIFPRIFGISHKKRPPQTILVHPSTHKTFSKPKNIYKKWIPFAKDPPKQFGGVPLRRGNGFKVFFFVFLKKQCRFSFVNRFRKCLGGSRARGLWKCNGFTKGICDLT